MDNILLSDPNSDELFGNQKTSQQEQNLLLSDPTSQDLFGEGNILPNAVPVTQAYGNSNPNVEVFSHGVNTGADFGVSLGTPVNLPSGNWKVVDSFDQAKNGYIGDNENKGYGNSILVKNIETGETLRFSHLSQVGVKLGDILTGGHIGQTGDTGNASGPHLDVEYKNSQGNLGDVLQSPYGKYLPTRN